MKRRRTDRKVNYASVVKLNMRITVVDMSSRSLLDSRIVRIKRPIERKKCLTTH
jgi:hypothetical protein